MRVVPILCIVAVMASCESARAQPDRMDSVRTPPSSALMEFWSAERLREATELPVPVVDPNTLDATEGDLGAPAPLKAKANSTGKASSLARVSGNVTTRPLYWAGKFFFSVEGKGMVCSAQFVAPGVLITAAHCVRNAETGERYTNFLYKHQYNRGRSAKEFSIECYASYNGWVAQDNSKWQWDYAILKTRGGEDQGHFGYQVNWFGTYQNAPKIGYPGAIEHGQVIQVDFGNLSKGRTPRVVGLAHGNQKNAEGSSGGAWVGAFDTTGNNQRSNFIISVTSHHIGDDRGTSYGPYWDQRMEQLLSHVQRGCR
jgi:trypsin